MAELLKNIFNQTFIEELAFKIKNVYLQFASQKFINDTLNQRWNDLSFKSRIRHITMKLRKYLPYSYKKALIIIDKVANSYPLNFNDITLLIFPDFVEMYGLNQLDWDLSIRALEKYTKYSTSEFAVRKFIIKNKKRMMQQIAKWTTHENDHVRRLASEGCRPQLPWGQVLTFFKKDPSLIVDILEKLKSDSSFYVRKSVANNLNDISKTHPQLVIEIAKRWYGDNKDTNWIVKHGCRTILKKGNKEALAIFGFFNKNDVIVNNFNLNSHTICIGQSINFSFELETTAASKIRLEYAIDFVKANGTQRRKIFQISEKNYDINIKKRFIKKHSFINLRTRKHYPGKHVLILIVNGIEKSFLSLDLLPMINN